MQRWLIGMACVLALSACNGGGSAPPVAGAQAAAAATSSSTASADPTAMARYDGYGKLRFGMDEVTFGRVWSGKLQGQLDPGSSCYYVTPEGVKAQTDFAFMFEGGHFVRYDVGTTKETAPGGGQVGMSKAQILALYGARVEQQPHKYESGAAYLRVPAPQGKGVLLFETNADGKVTRWRAGVSPQVDYVEGCS